MRSGLNLRHLEAFRAVMVAGTVVGAARMLSLTQPGVSRTISLLELRLGYALFDRRGRRLVPTAEAEALHREMAQAYSAIERITQVAEDIRFQRAGVLRIATLPAWAQWLVPQAVARFLASRPRVSVFVQTLPSRQIAELVATRQYDIGLVELPLPHPGIEIEPLESVQSVAVLPATHRLAAKKQISLLDLEGERMVLLSQHSYVRYQIDDAFSTVGVAPTVVVETPSSAIACAMVAAGIGITLVSRWTAEPFIGKDVVVRSVKEPLSSRHAIIYPKSRTSASLAQAFAVELKATMVRSAPLPDRKNGDRSGSSLASSSYRPRPVP